MSSDETSSKWVSLASMPEARSHASGGVTQDGTIILTGGNNNDGRILDSVISYDRNNDQWNSDLPPMGTYCYGHGCVVYENKVYVYLDHNALTSVEMLDLDATSNGWTEQNPMAKGRRYLGVERVGKKIYVSGGRDENYKPLDSMECFDLDTNAWETNSANLPTMPSARASFGTTAVENKIYVVGGYDNGNLAVSTVMSFDTSSNKWEELPSMKTKRAECAVVGVDHFVVVMGGIADTKQKSTTWRRLLKTIEVYDTQRQSWLFGRIELSEPMVGAFAAVIPKEGGGHDILIAGGADGDYTMRKVVEAVDFEKHLSPF